MSPFRDNVDRFISNGPCTKFSLQGIHRHYGGILDIHYLSTVCLLLYLEEYAILAYMMKFRLVQRDDGYRMLVWLDAARELHDLEHPISLEECTFYAESMYVLGDRLEEPTHD